MLVPVRSRYRVNDPGAAHFITATVVDWLPIFTTASRCDVVVQSLNYCQEKKGMKIHAWVILDSHFHAILAAPDLSQVLADLKRHTARQLLELLETENCDWLLAPVSICAPQV